MEIVPATPERWDDLADLFTRQGSRSGMQMTAGCWCMWLGFVAVRRAGPRTIVRLSA